MYMSGALPIQIHIRVPISSLSYCANELCPCVFCASILVHIDNTTADRWLLAMHEADADCEIHRCFLMVTRSKGMQVMTYEGQQVCAVKFQGKS